MFTVDGMVWDLPCDIDRVSEVESSEISGMLLNKNYFNDVVGTFLRYTITLVVPFGAEAQYARLYEILTQAVDAHTFILPYNEGNITVVGRVQTISDVYRKLAGGRYHWRGIKFNVVSNSPNKTHTLGEAIARGISPIPDVSGVDAGAIYQYDGTQWVEAEFQDADNIPY